MNLANETLFPPLIAFVQEYFGQILMVLDGFMPFTSLAIIIFLVLFSTSIYDMFNKDFWVNSKLILLKNILKLLSLSTFITGYLSLTLMILVIWLILDKYIDYKLVHRCSMCIYDKGRKGKSNQFKLSTKASNEV